MKINVTTFKFPIIVDRLFRSLLKSFGLKRHHGLYRFMRGLMNVTQGIINVCYNDRRFRGEEVKVELKATEEELADTHSIVSLTLVQLLLKWKELIEAEKQFPDIFLLEDVPEFFEYEKMVDMMVGALEATDEDYDAFRKRVSLYLVGRCLYGAMKIEDNNGPSLIATSAFFATPPEGDPQSKHFLIDNIHRFWH